jgi:transcriptional regulator with XRE-family HTH domain
MVGVHTTAIGRWERGEQTPTFDKAQDIVKALGGELVIRERI